jgi:hypothetical protein
MNGATIDWLQLAKVIADVLILPAFAVLWSIQGRLSKIEGVITTLLERRNEPVDCASNRISRGSRRYSGASDNRP